MSPEPVRALREALLEALRLRVVHPLSDIYLESYAWLSHGHIRPVDEGDAVAIILGQGLMPFVEFASVVEENADLLPEWLRSEVVSRFDER